jgi:PAS domain S-box-containing protein
MIAQSRSPRHGIAIAVGALLSLFGAAALLARHLIPALSLLLPGIEAIHPLTALYLLLCGAALLSPLLPRRFGTARTHLLIGALLCLLTLSAMANPLETPPSHNISLAFFFAGLLLIIGQRARTAYSLSILFLLLVLVCAIALLGGVGLALGFDPILGWTEHRHMSPYTISGLLLLALALAHSTWQRVRRLPVDPAHGISAVTGFLVIFIAFSGGAVIYTVAGANIYQSAKDELHRLAHERAERIFLEHDLARLRLQMLTERLLAAAPPGAERPTALEDSPGATVEVIDALSATRHRLGTPGPKPLQQLPLSSQLTLLRYAGAGFTLRLESSRESKRVIAEAPLRLGPVIGSDPLNKVDYELLLCPPGEAPAENCPGEVPQTDDPEHLIPAHWHRHGGAEPPGHHLGMFRDLSNGGVLKAGIHLPELQMVLLITRDVHDIFAPLDHKMLYGLPLLLLLFVAGIGFATWRITPLVRTIQHSEQRFRILAENANDLISLHNPEGDLLYVSPAIQRLLGYREEEVLGLSAYAFIHPDDIATVRQSHDTLATQVEMPRVVYRLRCKSGDYLWFESTGRLNTSDDGAGAEIITVSRDITAQHTATEELRISELKYRTLVEQASDAIILQAADRRFIEVNQAACDLFGYRRSELIGMHPENFLLPEDFEDARRKLEEIKQGMVASRRQLRRRDGSLVTVDIHSTGIEGGGVISVIRDISEQLRIETALRDSRERWRSLVETAPDTIMTVNREAELLFISRVAPHLRRKDVLGRNILDYVCPGHRATVRDAIARVYAGEEHVDYEIEGYGENGTTLWWSSRCGPVYRDGDIESVIIVTRDISERHRMELALRNSERHNRSVIEVLAEGIVVHDRSGAIVSSNRAAQAILGLPANSDQQAWLAIGMSGCHEDGQPFPAECHPAMVALATGRSQRDVIMGVKRPDGQRVWISINSEPIRDDDQGRVVSVVTSFSDITEQRRAETELRESRERLRALSTHLQEIREEEKAMIAREVHDELGGTMTALKLGISWLEGRLGEAEPVVRDKLAAMSRLLEQAVHTVRRLVTQLRPTILDDLGLWAALEWQLREFAQYSQLRVSDNLQDQVVEVNRPKALAIYRVLQEALTNIARHAAASKVRLDCWNRDGILHIMLEDDGMGLSETTTLSPTSHGLRGMYERIAAVGGRLEILSTPGEGTVITIEVPHD